MEKAELRHWVEDALDRHNRDARERDEVTTGVSADEIVDAVWGRLPLDVRRQTTRAEVQASLTLLTLRRGLSSRRRESDPPPALES